MTQLSLFSPPRARTPRFRFDGATIESCDAPRLTTQMLKVRSLMADGEWRTLREISNVVGAPEASVSARLRDWRKERNGGLTVDRRRRGDGGLFEYRMEPVKTNEPQR